MSTPVQGGWPQQISGSSALVAAAARRGVATAAVTKTEAAPGRRGAGPAAPDIGDEGCRPEPRPSRRW